MKKNFEDQLETVAVGYKANGYGVVVRPGPEDLPDFAKDFVLEILATRPDGNVFASVKATHSEFFADADNLQRYGAIINKQPGWRFDLFNMANDKMPPADLRDAKEPTEEDIRRHLDGAEQMFRAGFLTQSVVAAWAALESAMRRRLWAEGEKADWATSSRGLYTDLYAVGVLNFIEHRDLGELFHLRSMIVHGYSPPVIEHGTLRSIVETAQRFLDETHLAKQSA